MMRSERGVVSSAGNLGGGFLLFRRRGGFATAVDYRETVPVRAARPIFMNDRRALEKRGHPCASRPRFLGDVQGVLIDPGPKARFGASNGRGSGAAAGY
ncbi:MAG: hypothetical protein H7Z41_18495 [Cytophagales bacterium]|nr:hypothetical protein [Armatimonadota bacterium]